MNPLSKERGSTTLEAAIVVPVTLLIILIIVMAGRIAMANQAINAVACDTARAASLARDVSSAHRIANATATTSLESNGLHCTSQDVRLDTSGLHAEAGTRRTVGATVTCTVELRDITFPGMPSSTTLTATVSSPVDPYRERNR